MPESGFLYVEVIYDFTGQSLTVSPNQITLQDSTKAVVWWCSNLPAGRTLAVSFTGPQGGPFITLSLQGDLVVGAGNLGLNLEGPNVYPYQVWLTGEGGESPAEGVVINEAVAAKIFTPSVRCDRTVDPPRCWEE